MGYERDDPSTWKSTNIPKHRYGGLFDQWVSSSPANESAPAVTVTDLDLGSDSRLPTLNSSGIASRSQKSETSLPRSGVPTNSRSPSVCVSTNTTVLSSL
jgi:hypothetical protein